MPRVILSLIGLLGISTCALGQAASPDTQTLKELLSEVRALRQDLRLSLNRAQSMQILLARFQMQEGVITRASDRLNDARRKLLDLHDHQKALALEAKRLEDAINAAQNQLQQTDLQDRLRHVKSDLAMAGSTVQEQQAIEIQAERNLREEQDRLNALETQLDQIIRSANSPSDKSDRP